MIVRMSVRTMVRAWTVLVLVLLVGAGCGLAVDESPRNINSQDLPEDLRLGQLPTPTPQIVSGDGPGREQVHMLQDNRLVTVERQIASTPERVLELLLQDTFPEEAAVGISSAIFRGARVQRVDVVDLFDLAVIDLAPGSLDPRNTEQRLAFAQFVYTLTSLPGIEAVQFVSTDPANPDDGPIDLAVQTDTGTTLPGARVTRADFELLATAAVALPGFDIPVARPTPTPDPDAPPVFPLPVWMLDANNHLIKVERTIEFSQDAFLRSVLGGPLVEERELGITSALPPDALAHGVTTAPFDVTITDEFGFETLTRANIALVDMTTGSLPNDSDESRLLAFAQIVYTLTELEGVDRVAFSIDGVFIPVPSDQGLRFPFDPNVAQGVSRADYTSALPQVPVVEPGSLGPAPATTPTPTPTPGG